MRCHGTMKYSQKVALISLVLWLYACDMGDCGNVTDMIRLRTDLLNGYNRRVRPLIDQSKAIQVNVTFRLSFIKKIDEVLGHLSTAGSLTLTWYDELLTWDPASYGNTTSIIFDKDEVWYPRLILGADFTEIDELVDDWVIIGYESTGFARTIPASIFDTHCPMDALYYPFDTQKCVIFFGAWGVPPSELELVSTLDAPDLSLYAQNGEWDIVQSITKSSVVLNTPYFTVTLSLKRRPMFTFVNIVLPILLMSLLGLLVFVLPVESGERLSFIVTVLLAVAVFLTLVVDVLPTVSDPVPRICFYIITMLILLTCICVITVFNLKIYFMDEETPLPSWCKSLAIKLSPGKKFRVTPTPVVKQVSKKEIRELDSHTCPDNIPPMEIFETPEQNADVTWKDISAAVDIVSLIMFSVLTIFFSCLFLGMLAANT